MPICIYCGAQTMDFVVLPTPSSASIQPWLTAHGLDTGRLSSAENFICSSHIENLRVNQATRSDPAENNLSTFVPLGGDSEQDERFRLALSSMRNVSLKEEVPTEFGYSNSAFKDPDQSRSRPGPSGSQMQSTALPTPPVTPTQVCDVTSSTPSSGSDVQDCPICLQPPQLPIKLPCNHIFCYLCAKGFASRIGRCAYCRTEIPPDFMRSPTVVPRDAEENQSSPSKYYWFYAGADGWWQFEERHCQELEEALSKGDSQHELQVSGFIYVIDFVQMVQYRRDRPGRTRRIKRDIVNAPRKGVAGLRDNLINGSSM